jgi:hypothetical protein
MQQKVLKKRTLIVGGAARLHRDHRRHADIME